MPRESIKCVSRFLPAVLAFALASCSLRGPAGGNLEIVLERGTQPSPFSGLLSQSWLTSPSTLDDFTCFTVNVTGPGIFPSGFSPASKGCTSTDGFHGSGLGIVAPPTALGVPVKLLVPAGTKRAIDVYGMYPAAPECGGSPVSPPEGYFLGRVVADLLLANNSVTVPISLPSGTPSSFTCTGGNGFQVFTMFPYGGRSTGGFSINVSGSGFQAGASVTIGGQACTVATVTPSVISCAVPTGGLAPSSSYPVVVTNGDGATLTVPFNYYVSGAGTAFISVDQNTTAVNFGPVPVAAGNRVIRFNFINTGDTSQNSSPAYPNADFTPATFPGGAQCGATLNPLQACYVDITFDPSAPGNRGGGATIFNLGMTFNAGGF